MRIKHISCLAAVLISFLPAGLSARKAVSGPVVLCQPDGSCFTAVLHGDEFSHVTMTTAGEAVIQDAEGWWCYAHFDAEGRRHNSGCRVSSKPDPSAAAASRLIPFDKIAEKGARRRALPDGGTEETLIRRLNRLHYGAPEAAPSARTKAGPVIKHGLIILCSFKDVPFTHTREEFVSLVTQAGYDKDGAVGCVKEYFDAQFGGLYEFDFDISEIVTLNKDRSYYGGNDDEGEDLHPELMVKEACLAIDPVVDFSKYDDDNDGKVDNVFVFYAGGDEAEAAGDDCIWAHSWYLFSGARVNLNLDGKKIDRYACAAEKRVSAVDRFGKPVQFKMASIGTFCHEFSHTLGLPDFYDTDYEASGGLSDALWGRTSLMDSGNANDDGNTPPSYNSLEREILGIGSAVNLPEGKLVLSPLDAGGTFYRVNSEVKGEYYLLEFRKTQGWDKYIGGSGLLVYHIDKSNRQAGYSETIKQNLSAFDRWETYNEINCRPDHQCADLIEASPTARSAASVFFPNGGNNGISPTGTHKFSFWDGSVANVTVSNIAVSGNSLSMSVIGDSGTEIPPDASIGEIIKFQDAAIVHFSASYASTASASVSWGPSGKEQCAPVSVESDDGVNYTIVIEGLEPGQTYSVTVVFSNDRGLEGKADTNSFMTASLHEGSAPYIYLKCVNRNQGGSFPAGCALPLRLFNALSADGVVWTYDGKEVGTGSDGFFHPSVSGLLKAEIIHADGSRDFVAKKINIR